MLYILSIWSSLTNHCLPWLPSFATVFPESERRPIDKVIDWLSAWNPDVLENKTFDEQVVAAREHLCIDRWSSFALQFIHRTTHRRLTNRWPLLPRILIMKTPS
jgi:hypothetical protein